MSVIYRVIIIDRQKKVKLPKGLRILIRRVCNSVLARENFEGCADISVILVDNSYIQSLNKQFRNKDCPTDMLSFPAIKDGKYDVNPETGAKILGDIVLSIEKAREEAEVENSTVQEKIMFWTAHSLLHLLGYDHEDDPAALVQMNEIAKDVVNLVGGTYIRY